MADLIIDSLHKKVTIITKSILYFDHVFISSLYFEKLHNTSWIKQEFQE